jgi:hypothetical protein
MSDTTNTEGAGNANEGGEQKQEQTFSQADIDRIVKERLAQQAKNQFGDYAELKAKADGAKTVEQQLADLATKHAAAEARILRADIASTYGISKEDRDLFLTGSDEASIEAQAKRLAERNADQKKAGNRAPREGRTTTSGDPDKDMREAVRSLFGRAE